MGLNDVSAKLNNCCTILSNWKNEVFGQILDSLRNKKFGLCLIKATLHMIIRQSLFFFYLPTLHFTQYFHHITSQRRRINVVHIVLDDDEAKIREQKGIKNVFIRYFSSLFTSSNPSAIDVVIESCCSKISSEYKDFLDPIVSKEEVHSALKEIGMDKAPGPNGVTVGFY